MKIGTYEDVASILDSEDKNTHLRILCSADLVEKARADLKDFENLKIVPIQKLQIIGNTSGISMTTKPEEAIETYLKTIETEFGKEELLSIGKRILKQCT